MKIRLFRGRSAKLNQRNFSFVDRSIRRERHFKRAIALATSMVVILILISVPWGRYLSAWIETYVEHSLREGQRVPNDRAWIEADRRNARQLGIDLTRTRVDQFYSQAGPDDQRLMRYAGLDPEHGLLRWGNYDWTLLLSSKVFAVDDEGRSYRLRPRTKSIWLKNAAEGAFKVFFLVPDQPELADLIRGSRTVALASSRQTTNSWGVRGPEPEPDAPVRVMVLGDSFMMGMFIGDDETPPQALRRYLEKQLKTKVSVLNTGVLGYSPEQYYYSLLAFAERFRPQLVVVSVFPNDFGNALAAISGGNVDWNEGKYWLRKIVSYCRARHWSHLIVAAPYEQSITQRRLSGYYPGKLVNAMHDISLVFLDPTEEFVNAYLEILIDAERDGITLKGCPLFNSVINDDHFSAVGSEVWASSVGRRVALLLKRDGIGDARNRETRRAKGTTVVPEKGSAIRGISRPSDLSARSRDRSNPAVLGGDETVATRPGVARTNGACSHPVSHQSVRTLSIRTFGGALPIIPPSGVTPIGVTS